MSRVKTRPKWDGPIDADPGCRICGPRVVPTTFLSRKDVVRVTTLSRSTMDDYEKRGLFPRRVVIGPGRVAWVRTEILDWIAARVAERAVANK
jgi:prophage regulatory protein